jgi:hypothetical protein
MYSTVLIASAIAQVDLTKGTEEGQAIGIAIELLCAQARRVGAAAVNEEAIEDATRVVKGVDVGDEAKHRLRSTGGDLLKPANVNPLAGLKVEHVYRTRRCFNAI